jgi:LysR family nitrogen assimilation transcriptional regulator
VELKQLRYFVTVANAASFTRASSILRISQPALGLQIKKLEEELAAPLFHRHSRGVELTEAGAKLLKHAETILSEVAMATAALRVPGAEIKQRVRIGMAPSIAAMFAQEVSAEIARQPGVQLDLVEATSTILSDMVLTDSVDFALSCETLPLPPTNREHILDEPLFFVRAAHGGVPREPSITFKEVARHPIVLADPMLSRVLLTKLESTAAALNVSLDVRRVLPSVDAVKALVEDEGAYTVMPYVNVRRECERGWLCAQEIVSPTLSRVVFLLTPPGHSLSQAASSCCAIVREVLTINQTQYCRPMRLLSSAQAGPVPLSSQTSVPLLA